MWQSERLGRVTERPGRHDAANGHANHCKVLVLPTTGQLLPGLRHALRCWVMPVVAAEVLHRYVSPLRVGPCFLRLVSGDHATLLRRQQRGKAFVLQLRLPVDLLQAKGPQRLGRLTVSRLGRRAVVPQLSIEDLVGSKLSMLSGTL